MTVYLAAGGEFCVHRTWRTKGASIIEIVTHQFAGITFRTESNVHYSRLDWAIYKHFRVSDDTVPDVRQRLFKIGDNSLTLPPPDAKERERFAHCTIWSDEEGLNGPLLRSPMVRARLETSLERPGKTVLWLYKDNVAILDFSQCELDHFYTEELGGYDAEFQDFLPDYRIAANLRQIFSSFLPNFSALLIHSSGVIREDRAAIFLAPDAGGKTTILSLVRDGNQILGDDQIVWRQVQDSVVAYATPLGTMTSGPCSARIGALFVLQRARHFELAPLRAADLVQTLWTEHQNNTFFLPQYLKKQAFQVLCNACFGVPVYRMRFSKEYVDWGAIEAAMR